MKIKNCKLAAFFMIICIAISVFNLPVYAEDGLLKGFEKAAENSNLSLYVNNTNSDFVLLDKSTKSMWWSNPYDRNNDTIAKGTFKMNLSSHILLKYVDQKGQKYMANDYTASIQKKGLKVEKINNGVKVTYTFDKEQMTIPVQYTLEKDFLKAEILLKEVKEKGDYKLTSISLLPYFGAGNDVAQGYMLIPDGAGALINFNNGKTGYATYAENIYGRDNVLSKSAENVKKEKISMPVFGIKNGNDGMLAVVTEGDSVGVLNAAVSGMTTSYNNVYCEFEYRAFDSVIMREREGTAKDISIVSKMPVDTECFSINYYPLKTEENDYSGMASRYQQYLVEEKGLKASPHKEDLPIYINAYGGIEKKKYIFGIPVNTVEKLTTYKQSVEMLKELKSLGINNVVFRYLNWSEEEIYGKIPSKISLEGKLGSSKDFNGIINYARENNIEFCPNADLANIRSRGNGYSIFSNATQTVSRAPALQYLYSISNYFKRQDVRPWYMVSPQYIGDITDGLTKSYNRLGLQGVSTNTLGNVLYSDYSKKSVDRNSAEKLNEEALKTLNEGAKKVVLDSANAYSIPNAAHILNTPFSSSKFDIFDKEIPFYQMVLHGYVSYSLEPMNISSNQEDMFLKMVETGSSQLYSWIANDSQLLKETDLDFLYSGNYKSWIKTAADEYKELNDVFKKVQAKKIVKHTELTENVYETTYENGVKAVVNYNKSDVVIGGKTIKAKSYAVYEGGRNN